MDSVRIEKLKPEVLVKQVHTNSHKKTKHIPKYLCCFYGSMDFANEY